MSIESKIPDEELNIKDLSGERPEKIIVPIVEISDDDWDKLKLEESLERAREKQDWQEFCFNAYFIKMYNPQYDLKLTQEIKDGMYAKLQTMIKEKDWMWFATMASQMKVMNPSLLITLDQPVLEAIGLELQKIKQDKNQTSYNMLYNSAIVLLSKKVVLKRSGLELEPPDAFGQSILKDLPITRKF